MNTSDLKAYAPKARKDFIAAVTRKAELLGLNPAHPGTVEQQGDVLLINGQAYPARIANQRARLATRIAQQGFAVVMEALAYTWFNRLVAIRYMELHGYLDHGYRVLSHPDGGNQPEILEHLARIDLPGLDRQQALEWKAIGNRDEDLYRAVLLAQCHALHTAMPFLFEAIDDATELLLPDGLLRTDSLIRELVTAIDDASWQDVEIIGWLYQFYISEKKDQVMGKVVKSEDIPAATQLFTPNWIVKYMVQNSLGAQWLATYPESGLKAQMAYYIEPAEQTDEVKAQLAAITPASLDPEALTLIDPACGSGHILVEAYELFKAIYLERGYVLRDIPKLILERNLYGLDIDERAAQLTGFALMMKARADDRRLFERGVQLNVMALQDSTGFDAERLAQGVKLADYGLTPGDLTGLKALFEHATTIGSLIQVPEVLAVKLPALRRLSETDARDLFVREAMAQLMVLVRQAEKLAARYDAVVANPPYMGVKLMPAVLKHFVREAYPGSSDNLCGCFIERCFRSARPAGSMAMVGLQNWMFQSSFVELRQQLLSTSTLTTLVQIGFNSFPTMNSKVALAAAFCGINTPLPKYEAIYLNCNDAPHAADKQLVFEDKLRAMDVFRRSADSFFDITGAPISYWTSAAVRRAFSDGIPLASKAQARQGMSTSDNERFVRCWHEVSFSNIRLPSPNGDASANSDRRWVPYNKGGRARKWYGNNEFVVNWSDDGFEIKSIAGSAVRNEQYYFRPAITWSDITITTAFRLQDSGFIFANSAHSAFCDSAEERLGLLGLLNSRVVQVFVGALSQTLHFDVGYYNVLPLPTGRADPELLAAASELVAVARKDWDDAEASWSFSDQPLLRLRLSGKPMRESFTGHLAECLNRLETTKELEARVDSLSAAAFGVPIDELPITDYKQILLRVPTLEDCATDLMSYAIGCMMGRYSLDAPGLIYAHSGNEGFEPGRYSRFPADADGIVPVTDTEWFDDDACTRLVEFISVAWDKAQLEQNLQFLADNLSPKRGEASRDTIRRHLCDRFFKDHLQTYKKRPIYWLFTSGKEQAFQCLVYLHRYNAGTLSRMRMEYVVPLQSRMQARVDKLADDLASASSSAQSKQLQKLKDSTQKKLEELRRFDDKLRHYADQRITLDLDDGVKVNYGKFGDLLAEVKAVTGGDSDD